MKFVKEKKKLEIKEISVVTVTRRDFYLKKLD